MVGLSFGLLWTLIYLLSNASESFWISKSTWAHYPNHHSIKSSSSHLFQSSKSTTPKTHDGNTKSDYGDDEEVLQAVKKSRLIDLCEQYSVEFDPKDTKMVLLHRLRQHAETEAAAAQSRLLARKQRVEANDSPKERFEAMDDGLEKESLQEEEAYFYFHDPFVTIKNTTATSALNQPSPSPSEKIYRSQAIAPEPPVEPNEDGERVVTVYSTSDQNDLTGIGDAQPGRLDPDMASNSETSAAWDMPQRSASKDQERAKEEVIEIIAALLASTGAPAFADPDGDDQDSLAAPNSPFVGFDPSKVSSDLLTSSSSALRAGRGRVLEEVLHQFEMRAIAQDGVEGDDRERGGGHYAEVAKVRAFVEGFRRAEVRRLARETTTILLERLMQEGISGLDLFLSTMVRSDDDTGDYAGELNDSLLDFLNDAIRHQEKKVDKIVAERFQEKPQLQGGDGGCDDGEIQIDDDPINQMWNVTMEDGQQIQSLDPNNPKVKEILKAELERENNDANRVEIPDTAPEKVLLLLTLLRERIKAEATFAPDEKGRNLRLLAYCLQLKDEKEVEDLILKDLGNSLERLDSFMELVSSSIEYGESSGYTLGPAKSQVLNKRKLRTILRQTTELRKRQAFKASGLLP